MKKEVRYIDYHFGDDIYTVKLTYLPSGGFHYTPAVRVQVMVQHLPPRNFWERISEWWKYDINDYLWDPQLTDISLNDYCINKCNFDRSRRIAIQRCKAEWNRINRT